MLVNGKVADIEHCMKGYGKISYGNGHEKLIKDFYDCVARGEKFWIDAKEGSACVRQVLAAYRSNGQEVLI